MKRTNFESSVCRESDQHDWRFFITWMEDGDWVSFLFDADFYGLADAVHTINAQPLAKSQRNEWLSETVETYIYCVNKNNSTKGVSIGFRIPSE